MRDKKASFTLIELLCVCALVAFAFGIGGIQIPKLLRFERFERDVCTLRKKIELTQELVLDCKVDASVVLTAEDAGVSCAIETPTQLNKRWRHFLKPIALKEIKTLFFDGQQVGRLVLEFDGAQGGCPRGHLKLKGKKREESLFLPGYPGKIQRGGVDEQETVVPYPQEIFSLT